MPNKTTPINRQEKRMKKAIIGIVMVGVLLVSLASAGLVDFLSNKIEGTVEVNGPRFYLDMTNSGEDRSFSLILNDDNVEEGEIDLIGGLGAVFLSDELGTDSYYDSDFKIKLDLESHAEGNQSESFEIEIYKANSDGSSVKKICDTILLNEPANEFTCNAQYGGLSGFDSTDRLKLRVSDGSGSGANGTIIINGDSYIQVVAK